MISFEKMAVSHLPRIMEIESLSFSPPWSAVSFMSEIEAEDGVSLAALSWGEVVGYVCARRVLDEGHLLKLAVHPAHRRRGIGKALLREATGRLRSLGCKKIWLEVRASNRAAMKIYESLGFRAAEVRKGYYITPLEDAQVMVLGL